ncbi:MAG: hypothetical protein H6Q12_208 [Bacteroidetes bacterium]|nr:hypothetical protein [Bacteroidota bacterium]
MRNNSIYKLIFLGAMIIYSFLSASCVRRDLEVPPTEGQVDISFNWKNLFPGETIPAGMKLCFFRSDGVTVVKECTGTGFSGSLPIGIYKVLAYNTDATGVAYRNTDSYSEAQVYAPSLTKGYNYISQPLHVYGIGLDLLTVSYNQDAVSEMTPVSLIKKATFQLTVTGDKSAVASCNTMLTGIVQAVNISTGQLQNDTGVVSFIPVSTSTGFESSVSFFGKVDSAPNQLETTVNFTSGGSQTIIVDVTSKFTEINTIVVPIEVKVNIEVTGTVQTGFTAILKSWSVEDKNVSVY